MTHSQAWGDIVAAGRKKAGLAPIDAETQDRLNRQYSGPGKHAVIKPKKYRMRGLGDLLAWLFALVGIKGWTGCKCEARRLWLNRWFPFFWRNWW